MGFDIRCFFGLNLTYAVWDSRACNDFGGVGAAGVAGGADLWDCLVFCAAEEEVAAVGGFAVAVGC